MEKYVSKELMEVLKTKKAFVFDFDGTLASTHEILYQTLKRLLKMYDYEFTKDEYVHVKNKPSSEVFKYFESVVNQKVDAKFVNEEYLKIFNELTKTQELFVYDYVKEIVSALPDKIYCVASNNIQDFLQQRIEEFGFKDVFKNIYACGAGEINKKYVYQNIEKLCGISPKDCVLFEDSQKYIDEAKEEGFLCVAIVHKDNYDIKADYYIKLNDE